MRSIFMYLTKIVPGIKKNHISVSSRDDSHVYLEHTALLNNVLKTKMKPSKKLHEILSKKVGFSISINCFYIDITTPKGLESVNIE
eukprot:UN00913